MPFSYGELEPYYEKAEYAVGIAGKAGNLNGRLDHGGNVLEGPRQKEFPMPPLRYSGWHAIIKPAAERLGWHPFRAPSAVATVPYQDRPTCSYCGFCSGIGCHSGAKSSTDVTTIRAAEKTGNLHVVPNARTQGISVDSQGRATGVTYIKGGQAYFQPASVVFIATFAWENTRLLLCRSRRPFPAASQTITVR